MSGLGLSVGDQILGFVSGTTQLVGANGAGSAVLYDSMPDSLAYTTAYTVASNQVCRPNTAPSAALTATPVTGTTPYTVTFTASGTDPDTTAPADTIASYTLDYGDGTTSETQSGSPTTSSATFTHQYTNPGSSRTVYTAKLTVTDSRGKVSVNSAFQNIEVLPQATTPTNTAPMASLAASPVSGTSPLTVNFSGAGSSDPDTGDSVASYTFDFGDGSATVTQSSPTTSHVYNAAGSFTAKLMVTDTHAAASSNSATQVITVTTPTATNVAPTASLSASPGTGTVPLVVTFDGSKSSDPDAGDSVSSYTFDFGDGSAAQTQSTATVTHTYTSSGSYTATLVVTDTHGAKSTNTAQQTIVVMAPSTTPNTPPTAALKASPIAGTTPLAVTFDASGSSDADAGDRVTSYTFDFGDGSATLTQTSPTATHTYLSAGSFVASLTVMDMHAAVSPVPATAVINVGQPQPATPSEGRLGGGAFGGAELAGLMLLLAAGRRRRAARKGR